MDAAAAFVFREPVLKNACPVNGRAGEIINANKWVMSFIVFRRRLVSENRENYPLPALEGVLNLRQALCRFGCLEYLRDAGKELSCSLNQNPKPKALR